MALMQALSPLSVSLLAGSACSSKVTQDTTVARTHVVFRESPAVSLYFHVRAEAALGGRIFSTDLRPAIEAARDLQRTLGRDPHVWEPLEGLLDGTETAADIGLAFARVPERLELRTESVPLRASAQRLAAALVQVEPAYQKQRWGEGWEQHGYRAAVGRARWDERVAEKEAELLAFHLQSLGMRDPGLTIPVYLVAEAPPPGAVTHRHEGSRGVCFVAVDPAPGSLLYEVVLHEVTRALDLVTGGESALGELERKLQASGHDARTLLNLSRALLFVQSAESIRRVIDPLHRDCGEVDGTYEALGANAEVVRRFWRDHLYGKLSRSEALDGIVDSLAGAAK